ncbi:MAG: glycosyltransferase family 2 protein [Gemmatimonadetes bacterium]|nr:glycosyltransferase family 2 protein [Gemmatimonadota bacterium]
MELRNDSTPPPATSAGVSVVVPSYNHAQYVEKSLRSILAQTLAPAELIVIDDGSRDGSPQIIDRVLKDAPFPCELVARGNRGLCATLNEGLARSRGEYFTYLGSDDAWLPDALRERVELLQARPEAVLAYGHFYVMDGQGQVVGSTLDWGVGFTDGDARRMLLVPLIPQSSTVVYRRAAVSRYGWNEQARLEDYELFLRMSADGEFALGPSVLSMWRHHGRNTSGNTSMMMEEFIAAQLQVADVLGINQEEIAASQAAIRFNCASEFLDAGDRWKAARLTLGNLRGAPSASAALLRLARLATPLRVLHWRDERLRRKNRERYRSVALQP